jgi:hypothetical protein
MGTDTCRGGGAYRVSGGWVVQGWLGCGPALRIRPPSIVEETPVPMEFHRCLLNCGFDVKRNAFAHRNDTNIYLSSIPDKPGCIGGRV